MYIRAPQGKMWKELEYRCNGAPWGPNTRDLTGLGKQAAYTGEVASERDLRRK